ncbi:MAG: hypothetical protein MK135_13340, partial [Polyangiaceae bacterium]|nr:hypothetical protein [Polyangiaceae bacterium]
RGMGRTVAPAIVTFLSYYFVGLPLAWWLAVQQGWNLNGLWWGLATALAAMSILMSGWVFILRKKT